MIGTAGLTRKLVNGKAMPSFVGQGRGRIFPARRHTMTTSLEETVMSPDNVEVDEADGGASVGISFSPIPTSKRGGDIHVSCS